MYKTIPELFFETAEKYKNKTALLYKKEGVYFPISYQELAEKVKVFASALQRLGIERGDNVAILSENRPEWAISDLAIMTIGARTVPLHTTFSSRAIATVLKHSQSKILIVSNENLLNKLLSVHKKLSFLKKIIFIEKLRDSQKELFASKIISWSSIFIMAEKGENQGCYEPVFLDPDDPCTIIYTSGTTGTPKGVILTHRNFLSNLEAVLQVIPPKSNDVFLSFLPLSHVLERLGGYYIPLLSGVTIAYAENVKQLAQNLREIRPTILVCVPRIFEKFHDAIWDAINNSSLLKRKIFKWALKQKRGTLFYLLADWLVFRKIREKMGGRLRFAISGGASLDERIAKFFIKIGILILEGYGLTETSPVISVNREKDFKFGTVGKVIPGVKVKIANDKEILVKGPNVFGSYFRDKKKTKESFDKEGWFKTGDLGFLDKQGYLTIIGRRKEMIVTSGGKNVWPEPIEHLLNNDRFISQSIVIGNKRKFISALIVPDWQEVEKYFKEKNIVLKEHHKLIKDPLVLNLIQERIEQKINPLLSDVEKIKKFRLLASEFSQENDELTPTLKLRRHIIERHYQKVINSMY